MFKKFDEKENIISVNNAKNNVTKAIRNKLVSAYQCSEEHLDMILQKKDSLKLIKCQDHVEMFADGQGDVLFFKMRDDDIYPTLKLLHKFPFLLPQLQVDRGAIKHVLNGSNIMCPGLTSPGARMCKVDKGQVVAIMAEGKQHALAVGKTTMSTDDILSINKGIGVENVHCLADGLWNLKPVK